MPSKSEKGRATPAASQILMTVTDTAIKKPAASMSAKDGRYSAEPARTTKRRPFGEFGHLGVCPMYSANYRIHSKSVSAKNVQITQVLGHGGEKVM